MAKWLREELVNSLKDDRGSAYVIFNDFLVREFKKDSAILSSSKQFKLLTNDKKVLVAYANKLKMRYDWLESYNQQLKNLQLRCNNLVALIKSQYGAADK